jgi:hypothetical protein
LGWGAGTEKQPESFFCSELVAEAYEHLELMESRWSSNTPRLNALPQYTSPLCTPSIHLPSMLPSMHPLNTPPLYAPPQYISSVNAPPQYTLSVGMRKSSAAWWPSDFVEGGAIEDVLAESASLGREMLVVDTGAVAGEDGDTGGKGAASEGGVEGANDAASEGGVEGANDAASEGGVKVAAKGAASEGGAGT